ncbi:hypothetical protein GCM10010300_72650 [Streptomyces olivaceoviridis]|nr:hypothetical protein GCM10010300_72650 [Streptomyces olivaceoviridis]
MAGERTVPGREILVRGGARGCTENQPGPHAPWLLEWPAPALRLDRLPPGARVLDLGCGRAMTSVFPAREYGLQVTAADLWVKPDENAVRLAEADVTGRRCGRRSPGPSRRSTSRPTGTPGCGRASSWPARHATRWSC